MPDAIVAVFTDQQAAVGQLQDADGAAPNFAFVRSQHPAGEHFGHGAGGLSVFKWDKSDGLADPLGAVPGAMESQEGAALIFRGELLTGVEDEVQYGDVRTEQEVALSVFRHQV